MYCKGCRWTHINVIADYRKLSIACYNDYRYLVDRPYVCVEGMPSVQLAAQLENEEAERIAKQALCPGLCGRCEPSISNPDCGCPVWVEL